jgi:hypothetical protein
MLLRLLLILVAVVLGTSCSHSGPSVPLVVHVLRAPSSSFAVQLREADLQFGLTKPHLRSGRGVIVATNEGDSFSKLLRQFPEFTPDLLILDSQADAPDDPAIRKQLGEAELVCGQHPVFIPTSVSGEQREASQMYLRFLASHCDMSTVTTKTNSVHAQPPTVTPQSVVEEMFPNAPTKADSSECFRSLTPRMSIYMVVQKCGRPDEETGSGIYIFVYHLRDGSTVAIGTSSLDRIDHVAYTDASRKSYSLLPEK